jgi:antitoxin YefM
MIAVNYSTARENLKTYLDKATNDFETIIVTRKQGENVVIISEAEYNNILENLFVMGNEKNYSRILAGVEQLKNGQYKNRELLEDE